MPEITSVETIRAKLQEFEQCVDGAITAAKALALVKSNAEDFLINIERISTKSEQSLQQAEGVRLQLQELHREWEVMREQVDAAQAESKTTRDQLLSQLDSAIQSLGEKVSNAEERLKAANKGSLAEQAALLRQLDASTRTNADIASKGQATVTATAARLDELLASLRNELRAEVHGKFKKAEARLESESQRIEQYLEQEQETLREAAERQAGNNEQLLREEISTFKEEMKCNLAEHQLAIDHQLTDFLNKQNALVQNLAQQIDSFNRVTQAQSVGLTTANTKIGEIISAFVAHRTRVTNELTSLAAGIGELKARLADVQAGLHSQAESVTALNTSLHETSTELHQTIEKLRNLPLVGGKFK